MASPVQRIAWLDHARALSMAFLVLFHTPPRHEIVDFVVLFNMRVPIFFFISGLLFNAKRHNRLIPYIGHRCKQLLVPYVCFTLVLYALWLIVGRNLSAEDSAIPWYEPLVQTINGYPDIVAAPFWFVTCLFSMQLIHWMLYRLLHNAWWVLGVSVALWAVVGVMPDIWQWNVRRAFLYIPLYALGNALRGHLLGDRAHLLPPAMALALAAVSFFCLNESRQLNDVWLMRQSAVAASILLLPFAVLLSQWLARLPHTRHIATVIATNGIVYLALQNYVIGLFKLVLAMEWWQRVPVALAVMAVIYPISLFIERHLPWMLGRGPLFDQHH